jgi:low temperature requirement protein LtrA
MSEDEAGERHASWLELFFDLVAVAGIGLLAEQLRGDPSAADVARFSLVYLAFWTAWANITVYGSVAGDRVRLTTMLLAMLGLAVMAAAVAHVRDDHAVAFAAAFVFVRIVGGAMWQRGQVVVDWPLAHLGGGALPWIASLWVGAPGRYWLWGLGLAVDLLVMFTVTGTQLMEGAQKRFDHAAASRHRAAERGDRPRPKAILALEVVTPDRSHLAERLGLYVIIVLGEGIIQVTSAASDVRWDLHLGVLAAGAFAVLVGIWALALLYGHAGVPHLATDGLPTHLAMAFHCFSTGAIAALAAGLGAATEHADGHVPAGISWVLGVSAAVYFGIAMVAGAMAGSSRRWILGWALPCTLVPLLVVPLGFHVGAAWLVWPLVAAVAWHLSYELHPEQATT